jgi:hypothetical protein
VEGLGEILRFAQEDRKNGSEWQKERFEVRKERFGVTNKYLREWNEQGA